MLIPFEMFERLKTPFATVSMACDAVNCRDAVICRNYLFLIILFRRMV